MKCYGIFLLGTCPNHGVLLNWAILLQVHTFSAACPQHVKSRLDAVKKLGKKLGKKLADS